MTSELRLEQSSKALETFSTSGANPTGNDSDVRLEQPANVLLAYTAAVPNF